MDDNIRSFIPRPIELVCGCKLVIDSGQFVGVLCEYHLVMPDDGYADGGEPYTSDELEAINEN